MTYYEYVEKAKCSCGYIWTTAPSDNIRCACNSLELDGTNIVGTSLETDEDEFKLAVAEELQIDVSELTIIKL